MTAPTDSQLQDAAETLSTLVDLAAEGPTGEPDLHTHIAALDHDQLAHLTAVAAAVIHTDRQRANAMLDHAAQANRDLRNAHDRYLDGLREILASTSFVRARRIATDALDGP